MKYRKAKEICSMIMTREQMARMREGHSCFDEDADADIVVDLHRMNVKEAARYLKNLIAAVGRTLQGFVMTVIHGYNNGHALKDMLRTEHLSDRVKEISDVAGNPGRTRIVVC